MIHLYAWEFFFNSTEALLHSTGGRYDQNPLAQYEMFYITVTVNHGGNSVYEILY